MAMNHQPSKKDKELEDMIAAFLEKGGEVKKVKTKAMANELGISNNTWNQRLTKQEKGAKNTK
jgi:hypothetical protein|tara:strand:+ start:33 stop:221 length:189 start_codon:yes stop_codon:yes gene_type:complete